MKTKIEEIKVECIPDEHAEADWLGEYTDDIQPGVIVCATEQWISQHILFMGSENEIEVDPIPQRGRNFRFFKPYAGGEKPGTKAYRKYGMQDFKRMDELNKGYWGFIGIRAEATVSYSIGNGNRRLERLQSGGLWGIESDAGDYLEEVKQEELADLKHHLEQFGVDTANWGERTKDIELEYF